MTGSEVPRKKTPKPLLVLAFDVETTGDTLPVCPFGAHAPDGADPPRGDSLISVGWAGGRLEPENRLKILVQPARLDVDLRKPADVTWEDYWKAQGWSMETYRRFWSHRLRTLDSMQDPTAHSFAVAAHFLNQELAELEETYEIIPIVDTVGFDAPWVDILLNSQGYAGLGESRIGRPRRIIDAYSFRLGRALLDHRDAAPGHENGSAAARNAFEAQRALFADMYEHPHLADRDAKGILVAYLSSLASSPGS